MYFYKYSNTTLLNLNYNIIYHIISYNNIIKYNSIVSTKSDWKWQSSIVLILILQSPLLLVVSDHCYSCMVLVFSDSTLNNGLSLNRTLCIILPIKMPDRTDFLWSNHIPLLFRAHKRMLKMANVFAIHYRTNL